MAREAKGKKLKMRNSTFKKIWITIVAIVVVVAVALTIAGSMFSGVLDSYLGRGKVEVHKASGTSSWDATYNAKTTSSMKDAKAASDKVSQQVTDEGIVLLKNDGVLPLKSKSAVTPFGYGYLNPVYSGSGAAATTDKSMATPDKELAKHFQVNDAAVKAMKGAKPSFPGAADGTPALDADHNSLQAVMDKGKSAQINEYDPSIYNALDGSTKDSTGLVFIARNGSEGIDKRSTGYNDGTPHYLALTQAEQNTIKAAKRTCGKVVVVLNTANPMQVAPLMSGDTQADAVLWTGTAGSRGFASLADVLDGTVDPSGRLTDIYPTDFTKDPTYANFGEYHYTNATVKDNTLLGDMIPGASFGTIQRPFVEYAEGIYVGYKYYETAAAVDPGFTYGAVDAQGALAQPGAVAYPFGYGLSYTTFDQKLNSVKASGPNIEASVTVSNTGSKPGKDVAQLYYTSPYTDLDKSSKIEKAATNLAAFKKTKLLKPGESQTLKLSFKRDDMASYDYHHKNDDGTTGAYLLEAGDYDVALKNNSHDVIDSQKVSVAQTKVFQGKDPTQSDKDAQSMLDDKGNPTGKPEGKSFKAASNEFQTMNDYMDTTVKQLSRSDWAGTQPVGPQNREKTAPQMAIDEFDRYQNFDPKSDKTLGNVKGSDVYAASDPASGAKNKLSLIDLRGLKYNDPKWDKLLDQLDWGKDKANIQSLLYMAAYQTKDIESIGKPLTVDKDGAMGWSVKGASSWAGANVMAATWNTDLLKKVGSSIGEEGLQSGINGWYAPAVNIHRSPFSGRDYEYYSEDGVLSGKLAAASISGAGDKGVFSYLKHIALNDQETFRSEGLSTWANEQATRELYLKPFQIAAEEAKSTERYLDSEGHAHTKVIRSATGMMSAQNLIGGVIGFGHKGLLTDVLRGEWNFHGAVVTDLFMEKSKTQRDLTMRAGSDMYMIQTPGYNATDYDSPTAKACMRTAVHNVAYMVANSNAMNGMTPGSTMSISMSPWRKLLVAIDVLVALFAVVMVVWMIRRGRNEREFPERYRAPKAKKGKAKQSQD